MMSKEANERLKRDTQHVPLRQNAEEKVREKGLKRGKVYFQQNKKRRRPKEKKKLFIMNR